jgi:hypothetical protein
MYEIKANGKTYQRHAWTGGDTPKGISETGENDREYRVLRSAFFRELLENCGGLGAWKFKNPIWPDENGRAIYTGEKEQFERLGYYGTGSMERARIFWNEAKLNAWRTLESNKKKVDN